MAEINTKVIKRDGFNRGDEKQEITIELSGRMVVYGEDSKNEFNRKLEELVNEYAI